MFDYKTTLVWIALLGALLCLSLADARKQPLGGIRTTAAAASNWKPLNLPTAVVRHSLAPVLQLRAGSDNEYESEGDASDDDDEEEEEEEEEEQEGGLSSQSSEAGGLVETIVNTAWKTTKALIRASLAALDFSEVSDDASIVDHVMLAFQRMWNAAFSSSLSSSAKSNAAGKVPAAKESNTPKVKAATATTTRNLDFGSYLGSSYGVEAGRDVLDEVEPILTGSFQDALRAARSQARLLVALLPAHLPKKHDKGDMEAVESFLSEEVASVARKKAKKGATTGSFVLWSAKANSPEAALSIKRLKAQTTNTKGKKRSILAVAYPNQVIDSLGRVKIVPRLLAQHHCSPPPPAETMAAWLNALRKRHAKQYNTMQTELRELELFHERKAGYKESVKSDIETKKKEEREEAERKAREEAEKKRAEEIRKRRALLEENLPDEPEKSDSTARTVALRLADGRSAQRRFTSDVSLETVFGWVDVVFEIEQETVILTTLNGKLSFAWEDRETTLEESGLPKMAGLRVTIAKKEDEDDGETAESD